MTILHRVTVAHYRRFLSRFYVSASRGGTQSSDNFIFQRLKVSFLKRFNYRHQLCGTSASIFYHSHCLSTYVSDNNPSFFSDSSTSVTDPFIYRHIGPQNEDIDFMLRTVGLSSIDELMNLTIPEQIRSNEKSRGDIHSSMRNILNEKRALDALRKIAVGNVTNCKSLLGQGFSNTTMPAVIRRLILENPGWYSSYTPYQAEISQGRLEALLTYQTAICELTGMEIANASLLDESTAAAEAMLMLYRVSKSPNTGKSRFIVSSTVHPQTLNVLHTRARFMGIQIDVINDHDDEDMKKVDNGDILTTSENLAFGVLIQSPDTLGRLRNYTALAEQMHVQGGYIVTAVDTLSLSILKPPSEFGADVVVGSSQRLGLPVGFGGPHAGVFATRKQFIRQMPGRIIGRTKDAQGDEGIRMTLQTREQHIRKDKATSNICTSQALLASMSALYVVFHGKEGLQNLAWTSHRRARLLRDNLLTAGWKIINKTNFFDTLTIKAHNIDTESVLKTAREAGFLLRNVSPDLIGISVDETIEISDINKLSDILTSITTAVLKTETRDEDGIPISFIRSNNEFLKQNVFNMPKCETEIMRYLRYLERKDLGLDYSMIPLGSCTMKLNPASTMLPIVWPEFSSIHPFAPPDMTTGYRILVEQLSESLCTITGLDSCSLQPNSGASGEYTGLHAIRSFQESIGEGRRNICLIPKSAHGTNPASAALAGLKVKGIDIEPKTGSVNIGSLKKIIDENKGRISCAMITYPSTCGVFDENISEICNLIHGAGGQVYIDGANMNAQLGLTSPGLIGADVCHLNLHKTFSIPHGGGGPGVGPICVKQHLAPFLPSVNTGVYNIKEFPKTVVAAAPYGSAMILPISWMLIAMLGMQGLKKCGQVAILNANYMTNKLKRHYPIKYLGKNGYCAHEFILDVSHFKQTAGITEEDIAKRLMDYGFHAPTMSWPIAASLMIEPTESETKVEMDRFCDAMEYIREEIRAIEEGRVSRTDNPLKGAPHTLKVITADSWNHCYSRTEAAFPASWLRTRGKYWPSVGRLDNTLGDTNLMCSCNDVNSFESYEESQFEDLNLIEAM